MVDITVITRSGAERHVTGQAGDSLMHALRDGGIDEILALCGGVCSCGTCHVYVDPSFADLLGPITAVEDDLLDASTCRTDLSRLACQIKVLDALSGLHVEVAPEE